jgi:hypothetical protein
MGIELTGSFFPCDLSETDAFPLLLARSFEVDIVDISLLFTRTSWLLGDKTSAGKTKRESAMPEPSSAQSIMLPPSLKHIQSK